MKVDAEIIDRLKELTKTPMIIFPAVVDVVHMETFTCTVTPFEDAQLFDVRLKAGVENISEGIVEIPAEESNVLVAIIGNDTNEAFVVKCSNVKEVLFYGGENGGLIKVGELVQQLEKITAFLDTLKTSFKSPPPITPADGGLAYFQYMDLLISNLPTGDYSNIENPKVKH